MCGKGVGECMGRASRMHYIIFYVIKIIVISLDMKSEYVRYNVSVCRAVVPGL